MPALTEPRIAELLAPYLAGGLAAPPELIPQVSRYLDLLMLWNGRTNLTSVREPELLVQRQIGESLFAARFVESAGTLLDFGSGGGFPGIPIKLLLPKLRVTLAESQGKKASFLREALRTLALEAEVWSARVETLAADRLFDVVAMRAVDQSAAMLPLAEARVAPGGRLLRFVPAREDLGLTGWKRQSVEVPLSQGRLDLWERT